ncbi:MAG TPA: ribose-phosphate diphosphokinase [Actinomycetota bacterium]|nr:ribose-phosphate diphosphokinase [Actinomycetota bacterium]
MEITTKKRMMLFTGSADPPLAKEIADHLGMRLSDVKLSRFASGEIYVRFDDSVRGSDAFVIQSHADPVNESIMEQAIMIDALKRASAKRITAVVPYYGYSRQDKKTLAREPITAKLVADILTVAGADRVMSVDLHSGQIQGFFDFPFDHLTALPILAGYLREELGLEDGNLVVVAPDAGRVKTAERLREQLDSELAYIYKRRSRLEAHKIETMVVEGDVDGRACVLVDDMIDTAGTITAGAQVLREHGATDIYAAATHPVFSGEAVKRLADAPIRGVVVTNTLPIPEDRRLDKITVLSVAPIMAAAIKAVFEEESVSELFHGENMP